MKKILFDTNIILDVLLDRQPFADASAAAWTAVETGRATGLVDAHAVTTIHYLLRKQTTEAKANRTLAAILRVFSVAPIDGTVVQEALQLPLADFEHAVTAASAASAGCDWIVTRDVRGFRASPVRALTPEALTPLLK